MYAERMAAEARARGDEAKAAYWDRIRAKVDEAPPLDAETRSRLAVLLRPAASAPALVVRRMPSRRPKANQTPETATAAPVTTGTAA